MKTKFTSLTIAIIAMLTLTFVSNHAKAQNDEKMKMAMDNIKTWPMASQMAVKEMMGKYGNPNEVTPTIMVWNNNGIWKKTIVSKEENEHDFPKKHMDVMEQIVCYRVPADKVRMLDEFDGSVNVEKTQGFLSARCDKEENNLLALNLAYDIITGKKTVAEARKSYGEMIMAAAKGNKSEYMKKLMFSNNMNSPNPDVMTIGMN